MAPQVVASGPDAGISVVIPSHNRPLLLAKCLKAVCSAIPEGRRVEVIVVDDGSSPSYVDSLFADVGLPPHFSRHLIVKPQGGPASARNAGAAVAAGSIIVFTDDDCIPEAKWIDEITRPFAASPAPAGVEGATISDALIDPMAHAVSNLHGGSYQTCNLAVRAGAFKQAGGFDEGFRGAHREDSDFAIRLLKIGSIPFNPLARVYHPPRRETVGGHLRLLNGAGANLRIIERHSSADLRLVGLSKSKLLLPTRFGLAYAGVAVGIAFWIVGFGFLPLLGLLIGVPVFVVGFRAARGVPPFAFHPGSLMRRLFVCFVEPWYYPLPLIRALMNASARRKAQA